MKQKRAILVVLSLMLILTSVFACKNPSESSGDLALILKEKKQESIKNMYYYLAELKSSDIEYSLVFVENELEKARQSILSAQTTQAVQEIETQTLNKINEFYLIDKDEVYAIKKVYCDNSNARLEKVDPKYVAPSDFIKPDDQKLVYYFGKYECKHVVLIYVDDGILEPYLYYVGGYAFSTWVAGPIFCKGRIAIFFNQEYYLLSEAYENGSLSKEELSSIYSDYALLVPSLW